jgi:glycosyltransferase involved in cell wall biosynthesis
MAAGYFFQKGPLALFLPSLGGGGAERILVTLANGFAERGFATDLVLGKAEGPYLKDVSEKVRVVDLGTSRILGSLLPLVRYLRRERPEAMLSALSHANVIALWARSMASVPLRLVVSERNTLTASNADPCRLRARFMPLFMRFAYPKADGVVAVSGGVADDLAQAIAFPRERIKVIYNPYNVEWIAKRAQEALPHNWFTPGQPPVVLGVGRLTEAKDFPTLIRAVARLRGRRPARLIILGEGEMRAALEAVVEELGLSEDALLPGFVDNPYAWMRSSSVFVLSSRWEGLPGVLIEAMASGTPVVSTDCPSGPAEILENGKWGRLVPVGDAAALASAIAATLDEPEHPDVTSRAALFSVDKAVADYTATLGVHPPVKGECRQ